jgi:hypothetical protein
MHGSLLESARALYSIRINDTCIKECRNVMANEDHIAKVKRGENVWRHWRDENPKVVPDFWGADL